MLFAKFVIDFRLENLIDLGMADLRLNSPLQYVKGVGPKRAEAFAKHGFGSVRDIMFYFPRRYLDRTNVIPIAQLKPNESATIIGTVKAHGLLYGKRRRYEVAAHCLSP